MRLTNDGKTLDPEAWTSWIESVDKNLSKNPRIRPLFLLLNTKALTADDTYDTVVDFLTEYCNNAKLLDIETLLKNMDRLENGQSTDPVVWSEWNKSVDTVLSKNSESVENGFDAKQGYEVGIIFLDMYSHRVNSAEIIALVDEMKLQPVDIRSSTNPNTWYLWLEYVNKTLNKYRTF